MNKIQIPYLWQDNEQPYDAERVQSRRVQMRPVIERNRIRQKLAKLTNSLSAWSRALRKAVGLD
jgi:hypothetical protein